MVFLAGPRQVGKTYLAKALLDEFKSDQYLNWDRSEHRRIIMKAEWSRDKTLVVLDEVHKRTGWKPWLKGIFDTEKRPPYILVTGSARLDVFRRGGDSMLGRYFLFRLHPFSVKELVTTYQKTPEEAFADLWNRGGFPEPLFSTDLDASRWRKERFERLLRDDLLSIENVRNLTGLELLVDLLRERVGRTINYQSLAEDVGVSAPTIKSWIDVLERLYIVFSVHPYHRSLARAFKKDRKVFFYDYADIIEEAARFENMVAAHLLKHVHFLEDTTGARLKLQFLRDKEKREVDFIITDNNRPIHLIEAKTADAAASTSLRYYHERFPESAATQVVRKLSESRTSGGITLLPAHDFLASLQQ